MSAVDAGEAGEPADAIPADGRTARAVRTRAAIADALLGLLEEGELQPTATRIAERAGISIRLIYHHFGDLEALYKVLAERQGRRMAERAKPIDPTLPIDARVEEFVAQRAQLLEWVTPVRRASLLQEPFSEELTAARDFVQRVSEQSLRDLFADELDRLEPDERTVTFDALVMVSGWNAWDALRTSGRSVDEARAALHHAVTTLLPKH